MTLYPNNSGKEVNQKYVPPASTKRRFIEIPAEGIVCVPIMRGADTIGERRIDLSAFPTVDAVEVVHGRWKLECKNRARCSNCGAKMDGDMNGHPGCQMEL